MKRIILILCLAIFAFGCDKGHDPEIPDKEIPEEEVPCGLNDTLSFSDSFLIMVVDSNIDFPNGFFREILPVNTSIGYLNSYCLIHSGSFKILCTDNWDTARKWVIYTNNTSTWPKVIVSESENEKYYEFKLRDIEYGLYGFYWSWLRIYKCSYFEYTGGANEIGKLNFRPLTSEKIKEFCEYYIYNATHQTTNYTRLSSKIIECKDHNFVYISYYLWVMYKTEYNYGPRYMTLIRQTYSINGSTGLIKVENKNIRTIDVD
jgi:hypothetical protein